MKKVTSVLIGMIPILVNMVVSLRYYAYARHQLIFELGFDGYLDNDGVTHYQFGIGSTSQIFIFVCMIVSVIGIVINGKLLYKDKRQSVIYKAVNIGIILVMYVLWAIMYLDYYPLWGELQINYL